MELLESFYQEIFVKVKLFDTISFDEGDFEAAANKWLDTNRFKKIEFAEMSDDGFWVELHLKDQEVCVKDYTVQIDGTIQAADPEWLESFRKFVEKYLAMEVMYVDVTEELSSYT